MIRGNKIAWGITLLAAFGGVWLLRRGRQSTTPSLINTDIMKTYPEYPEYDMRSYGKALSRGYRNNNPVNMEYNKKNNWVGQTGISPEGRFAQFSSLIYGYRAALALLRGSGYIGKGINTIRKMIEKFAPRKENYTDNYINFVAAKSGIDQNTVIAKNDKDSLCRIVWAMAQFENENTQTAQELGLPNINLIHEAWGLL